MCMAIEKECACGKESARLHHLNSILPYEAIKTIYCPSCNNSVEFDASNMVKDNGWLIEYDMEVAALYAEKMGMSTVVHVGDSRLYRLREGKLEPVTRDHSLMQELIDRGFYTPEQARTSMNKNLVTRAIGIEETVQIDVAEDVAMVNDIYMMCSDGVTDMIDDELIEQTMLNCGTVLEKMTTELIRESNDAGGKDNISVILARPIKPFPSRNSLFSRFFDIFSS